MSSGPARGTKDRLSPGWLSVLGSRYFLQGLLLLFTVLMTLRTGSKGWDFVVFWQVAHDFLESGTSPYDLSRYGNMVFKYPPWILPFFLPLGLLPLAGAKVLWGLVQGVSLAYIVGFTRRRALEGGQGSEKGPRSRLNQEVNLVLAVLLLVFSGIWIVHGIVGQTSLVMLAFALGLSEGPGPSVEVRTSKWRWFLGMLALSAKVLTVFPLVHFLARRRFWVAAAFSAVLFVLLSLPLWLRTYEGTGDGLGLLMSDWIQTNFSGTRAVGQVRIGFTTREAQGLPSLLLRAFSLNEEDRATLLGVLGLSFFGVAAFGIWRLRRLPENAQWLGWLALTPTVQPLAWFHFYTFAYPLLAWAFCVRIRQRGELEGGSRTPELIALGVAALLIAAVTEKTLGAFGNQLEMLSVKSLGVFLVVWIATRDSRISSGMHTGVGDQKV